jgi:ankyrin repeat protein
MTGAAESREQHVDRCEEYRQFVKIDAAFRAGDVEALRAAVADPASVPNGPMPMTIGPCLVYAVYHSPVSFVRELLELGADPNADAVDGFPPLIAALTCRHSPSHTKELVALLLSFGADPNQRGINDYTPLHAAVAEGGFSVVELLLEKGADPRLATRIDECETPRELALRAGRDDVAEVLLEWEEGRAGPA